MSELKRGTMTVTFVDDPFEELLQEQRHRARIVVERSWRTRLFSWPWRPWAKREDLGVHDVRVKFHRQTIGDWEHVAVVVDRGPET
jgi:hypothetical protein